MINGQPTCHPFICDVKIIDRKGKTIVKALEVIVTERSLGISKTTSLASDSASVMIGQKTGVGARLCSEYVPYLVQVHCIAHYSACSLQRL